MLRPWILSSLLLHGVTSFPQSPRGAQRPPSQQGPSTGQQGAPSQGPDNNESVQSPSYPWLFDYPLPIPHIAQPMYTEKINGRTIEYYELTIEAFEAQIYPDLGPAHLVGYNGTSPGPTFHLKKGVESIVRVLNSGTGPASMHLHGSPSHAVWDGWASDLIQPGQYKDYYYPNNQAGPLWYHDHVDGATSPDVYYGQTGVYIISDPAEDHLGLPNGKYDVQLAITDKSYQSSGDLVSPVGAWANFFGDTIHVNGQPWPYLKVEPRKYRLRFYQGSVSRPYDLSFVGDDGKPIEFQVVASDSGLFEHSVSSSDVVISMGERYEVVFDFAPFKGSNITLMNSLQDEWVPRFANTDKVMRFVVLDTVTSQANNGAVPSQLQTASWPAPKTTVDHVFNFQHGGDDAWTINGVSFNDINNRVLARPPQGTVEVWQLNYASGPGVHPVHIHLVNLQVVSRTGGSRGVLPYEAAGLKDTVQMEPGESVQVRAVYGPWNGMYMFHCHNLIHEDMLMMDAMNVTFLTELGYQFNTTSDFQDPVDTRYAAKDYSAAAFEPAAVKSAISSLGSLNAYAPAASLAAAEAAYYATAGYPAETLTAGAAETTQSAISTGTHGGPPAPARATPSRHGISHGSPPKPA